MRAGDVPKLAQWSLLRITVVSYRQESYVKYRNTSRAIKQRKGGTDMKYQVNTYIDTDKVWTIEVPSLTSHTPTGEKVPATGMSPTWKGVEAAARDLISTWTGEPVHSVDVDIQVIVPDDIKSMWEESVQTEQAARAELQIAADLRRKAVHSIREAGYTGEAAARAFGISQQRINQLTHS